MSTYHEQVARIMAASVSVGSFFGYDEILARLRQVYPREDELRAQVAVYESEVRRTIPGFRFIEDGLRVADLARKDSQ